MITQATETNPVVIAECTTMSLRNAIKGLATKIRPLLKQPLGTTVILAVYVVWKTTRRQDALEGLIKTDLSPHDYMD